MRRTSLQDNSAGWDGSLNGLVEADGDRLQRDVAERDVDAEHEGEWEDAVENNCEGMSTLSISISTWNSSLKPEVS